MLPSLVVSSRALRPRTVLPWLLLSLILVAERPARADASALAALHDATVVTDGTLIRRSRSSVQIDVRAATSLTGSTALVGATVELELARLEGKRAGPARRLGSATTDRAGHATVTFDVPEVEPGSYQLVVTSRSRHGEAIERRTVEVVDRSHIHLRTDRPRYRAGQVLRWRATVLSGVDAHPVVGRDLTLRIEDPRGTAIWRGTSRTGAGGMVAGEVPLGDDLVFGRYRLAAESSGASTSEAVEVKQYRLPAFVVRIEADAPRDDGAVTGRVVAQLSYGEPVQGKVAIGGDDGAVQEGTLDAGGGFRFALPAGQRAGLRAIVTDGAGRSEQARVPLAAGSDDLWIALVPERDQPIAGRAQAFTVITTDGRGQLVPTRISVRSQGARRITRRSPGALRLMLTAPATAYSWQLDVGAAADDGRVTTTSATFEVARSGHLVRALDALVEPGEPVRAIAHWPDASGPVVATLLRKGTAVASAMTIRTGDSVHVDLVPPPGTFGLATVRFTDLGWSPDDARPVGESGQASVYLRPVPLAIKLATALRRRPGEAAPIAVEVTDAAGRAVPGAAISASVVDERALALGEPRPDLVESLRQLDVGEAEAAGLSFAELLRRPLDRPRHLVAEAILDRLPPDLARPTFELPALTRYRAEAARLRLAHAVALKGLATSPGAIGTFERAWRYDRDLDAVLVAQGQDRAAVLTPWRSPTTWAYAAAVDPSYGFHAMAGAVSQARLDELAQWLQRHPTTRKALLARPREGLATLRAHDLAAYLVTDAWGSALAVELSGADAAGRRGIDLVAAGPDRKRGTADDLRLADVFDDLHPHHGWGYGSGSGLLGSSHAGRSPAIRVGAVAVANGKEAAVRRRFDETVLWAAGITTDARGRAELTAELADSITGWKLAVEAVTAQGAIGAATGRIETFLPLHADAELPHGLTLGDRYAVPLVIANHGADAVSLEVAATAGGALALTDRAPRRVTVPRGETRAVHVEVSAPRTGAGTLALVLTDGGRIVDRVERSIEVLPRGELIRDFVTTELSDQTGLGFRVADDLAPGSARATLRLFRGVADQALDGLDGMLREPYGCFEQTSSTTYPNLLVLRLLRDSPGLAATRDRARALVGKGYQRLISYEVEGGGFSWFGEAPANQVLTAYGLLEFSDMAKVYPVDPDLIERTRVWLIDKQHADGSWSPDASWLHDWSAVQGKLSTTAYVAWTLSETGFRGASLDRALGFLRRHDRELSDPYVRALWAAAEAARAGRTNPALAGLMKRSTRAADTLRIKAAAPTLYYATGDDADVQVTALTATALQRAGRADDARAALAFLWTARSPRYGWGSTQSTVLALRAAALAEPAAEPTRGKVAVSLDGKSIGALDLARPELPSLVLPAGLGAGSHRLELSGAGAGLRAELRLGWRPRQAVAEVAGLAVSHSVPSTPVELGQRGRFAVTVHNPGRAKIAMPTVVIPIPPGFSAGDLAVDELRAVGGVARVEDLGSELRVYLRELGPGRAIVLGYGLEATASCRVTQRAAQAYAYYSPSVRGLSAPTVVAATRPPAASRSAGSGDATARE